MKKKLALILAFILMLSLFSACTVPEGRRKNVVNGTLSGVGTFDFGAEEKGATASGTVFVNRTRNEATATITVHIETAEEYPEGVSLYLEKGWAVERILADFPSGTDRETVYQNTFISQTGSAQSQWAYIVELGCDRNRMPENGGSGDVVVQLVWNYASVLPEDFRMLCSLGSGRPEGVEPDGVVSVLVNFPLE